MSHTTPDNMLPGELVVAQAHKAQQLLYFTDGSQESPGGGAISGTLSCTNYCFHFECGPGQKALSQYGTFQLAISQRVPLGSVKELYMIVHGRRKALDGYASLPKKFTAIEIICTDLRRLMFSVKHCSKNEASSIVNALARHTHPSSVSLLFAFDYAQAIKYKSTGDASGIDPTPSFLNAGDWQRELARGGVDEELWRISNANKGFLICDSLCPFIVVPANISDHTLDYMASLHHGNRLPIWCWSHPHTGVSLTRGAAPSIDDTSEAPDPNYMYAVSMARNIDHQVENKRTATLDVTKSCGTVGDLRTAFNHMLDFCLPDSAQEVASMDKKWLGSLDSAGWLPMVRNCLHLARKTVETMCLQRRPVFLQEEEGRDLVGVVSSLAQLMMDPHFRSISGFQCLVQKEWVAMGYPFTSRHNLAPHVATPGSEGMTEQLAIEAPTFLLFLDCVWQLSLQFPSAFEFSESYLLQLHNVAYSCLYGTFIFNSPKARFQASMQLKNSRFYSHDEGVDSTHFYEGLLVPAWGVWRDSLSPEDREQCLNPFYYVFGSNEARCDFQTHDPLPVYNQFSLIFDDMTPNLAVGGSYGLYSGQTPLHDLHVISADKDHYQMGLLLPETSSCSIHPWVGFFSRYIPEFQDHLREKCKVREREARLVKDVRALKDALNELELSVGTTASDLTSFIGAVLAAREAERRSKITSPSTDTNASSRTRLSAIVTPFEDEEEKEKRDREIARGSKTLPPHMESLAEFTETLYRFSGESSTPKQLRKAGDPSVTASPLLGQNLLPTGSGRSPITKTRVRVTRTESTEQSGLHSRWSGSPGPAAGHIPLLANKILIKDRSMSLEEEEEEGREKGKEGGEGEGGVGEVHVEEETTDL